MLFGRVSAVLFPFSVAFTFNLWCVHTKHATHVRTASDTSSSTRVHCECKHLTLLLNTWCFQHQACLVHSQSLWGGKTRARAVRHVKIIASHCFPLPAYLLEALDASNGSNRAATGPQRSFECKLDSPDAQNACLDD